MPTADLWLGPLETLCLCGCRVTSIRQFSGQSELLALWQNRWMAAKRDVRTLLEMLDDQDEALRHKAFLALGSTGRKDRAWVPDLIEALSHPRPHIRRAAAGALRGIGPPAAEAVPALVGLLSDADVRTPQVAADALAQIGPAASAQAVPALGRLLQEDRHILCRKAAVEALGTLARRDAAAIAPLIMALDDPDQSVRHRATIEIMRSGRNARDAVPALRRLLEREEEPKKTRAEAARAVKWILADKPPYRSDEPYSSIVKALEYRRPQRRSVADKVRRLIDADAYEQALALLEAKVEGEQDDYFWLYMFNGAREIDLATQHRYYERYLETSGLGGFHEQLERSVRSDRPVDKAMRRMVNYCARVEPDPGWKRFHKLAIDDDLARLKDWLQAAFSDSPPPDEVSGLWFELVGVDRDGRLSLDLHVSGGHPDDDGPVDRVIGGSWQPQEPCAGSGVLDAISKLAEQEDADALEDAEYRLALTYGGLAVRWLASTIDSALLLGGAPQRVLAVGFEDGDSIGVGTLRPDGLVFPKKVGHRRS